jgi:hypothetical protein
MDGMSGGRVRMREVGSGYIGGCGHNRTGVVGMRVHGVVRSRWRGMVRMSRRVWSE